MLLALWPAIMPMLNTQVKEPKRIIYQMAFKKKTDKEKKNIEEDECLMIIM